MEALTGSVGLTQTAHVSQTGRGGAGAAGSLCFRTDERPASVVARWLSSSRLFEPLRPDRQIDGRLVDTGWLGWREGAEAGQTQWDRCQVLPQKSRAMKMNGGSNVEEKEMKKKRF
ncbi:hypothetical protein SKAU_G00088930 [Synaphobranchus kaupii]|uniref:Uncharacterized protein n=1 Tax=Synaphobranchus kaupii TaxID=118154 RepID=A0A9Q1J442_SYNKA|nr:hypothetical protein SKAU_G00088930 [Synaphobranchus kaupii]